MDWNKHYSSSDFVGCNPVEVGKAAKARIAELERALKELRLTAALLLQNSEGCAVNHHGEDHQLHGEPGWLRDCRASIERAQKLIEI